MTVRNGKTNGKLTKKLEIAEMIPVTNNLNQAFESVLDVEPDMTLEEVLAFTGCLSRALLNEYLEPLLPDVDVAGLITFPVTFKPALEDVRRQIEAENSVRKLTSESTATRLEMAVETSEIPVIEDEPFRLTEAETTSAIAPSDPGQLAQGHHEQLQERLNLEAYAKEAEQGVRELAIEAAIQKVDNISADIKNAVLQRVAQKKAELFEEIGEGLLGEFMNETNSQLASPTAYAEIQRCNAVRKPDFLSKLQTAKEAWKNREKPSQPTS